MTESQTTPPPAAKQDSAIPPYGQDDTTFQSAGGVEGIRHLVDRFYDIMGSKPEYEKIHRWHPDETESRDKLARFLCGWMGGPRLFREKYGPIAIPKVHAHLNIQSAERDQWLNCMSEALETQDYPESLKAYLREQFKVPAGRIHTVCTRIHGSEGAE